jgi:hypothetical protein
LRSTIIISDPDDWHRILRSRPVYREDFNTWMSPAKAAAGMNVGSHGYGAIYRPDIGLTIAYGMRSPFSPSEPSLQWAAFPDPTKVTVHIADVFWRGSLVDRVDYAVVDSGRYILPIGEGPQWLGIDHHDYAVARLLDTLEGGDRFDLYYTSVPYEYQD